MDSVSARPPQTREAGRFADQLERAFRGGAWHGPAVTEALAGIDAELAARRPVAGAHTIREIVGHVSLWMDLCRQRIEGEPIQDVSPDEDWPSATDGTPSEEAWRRELALLEERHRRLHATVAGFDDARLDDPVPGSDPTVRGLILGILQHHAYHGGQIALLRKAEDAP